MELAVSDASWNASGAALAAGNWEELGGTGRLGCLLECIWSCLGRRGPGRNWVELAVSDTSWGAPGATLAAGNWEELGGIGRLECLLGAPGATLAAGNWEELGGTGRLRCFKKS